MSLDSLIFDLRTFLQEGKTGRASSDRFFERKEKGYKSYIKGMEFEKKVSNWLTDQGFRIKMRKRTRRV